MADIPKVVYHYCGVSGFQGIIQSKSLWLSDAYFMNDYMEQRLMLDKSMERLAALADKATDRQVLERIIRLIRASPVHPYICCFSSEPDLLSQWRAYSDDGAGFAIGFASDGLEMHCSRLMEELNIITFDPVQYEVKRQDEYLNAVIDSLIVGKCLKDWAAFSEPYQLDKTAFLGYLALWAVATTCKNHGFREEREARLVLMPKIRNSITPDDMVACEGISDMFFRVRENRLIPYFTFPFSVEDVVEIRLGPKNRERSMRYSIEMFLRQNGYAVDRIKILNSEATYQ